MNVYITGSHRSGIFETSYSNDTLFLPSNSSGTPTEVKSPTHFKWRIAPAFKTGQGEDHDGCESCRDNQGRGNCNIVPERSVRHCSRWRGFPQRKGESGVSPQTLQASLIYQTSGGCHMKAGLGRRKFLHQLLMAHNDCPRYSNIHLSLSRTRSHEY